MSTKETFCGTTLLGIGDYYAKHVSGYVDIPVCLIGMIFNIFNLLVFTRKDMISPVHSIFANLAFADLMVLLVGIPYSGIFNLIQRDGIVETGWTYNEATVYMLSKNLFTTFHLVSVFFTVQLAVWRYISIKHPLKERFWCNMETTRNLVIIGYIVCILLSIPIYLSRHVEVQSVNKTHDQVLSYTQCYTTNPILGKISFMVYGVLGTILPAAVLSVFSLRLIFTLLERKTQHDHEAKRVDRSVSMLLTVLVLFLVAEIPRGMLFLANMFYHVESSVIHKRCYSTLISIFGTIVYINTSITFMVYYIMSQQFRNTFKTLLRGQFQYRGIPRIMI